LGRVPPWGKARGIVVPLAVYLAIVGVLTLLGWVVLVSTPMLFPGPYVVFQLTWPGIALLDVLNPLGKSVVAIMVLSMGLTYLLEFLPSLCYMLSRKKGWLLFQGAIVIAHLCVGTFFYYRFVYSFWLD